MSMVLQATAEGKGRELQSQMGELQGFIRTAAATGLAVHEVEQELFKRLLELGHELQQWFFALLRDGDQGETVTTCEGQVLRRLACPACFGFPARAARLPVIFPGFTLARAAGRNLERRPQAPSSTHM